jgi:hypothetical protein
MLASLIRPGMARIRARTAISFVLLVYAGRVLAQNAPASPDHCGTPLKSEELKQVPEILRLNPTIVELSQAIGQEFE